MMTAEEIAELRAKLKGITPLPWCAGWMSGAIRHVVRNVDTDAFHDHDGDIEDCAGPDRYDGDAIAAVMNAAPRLLDTIDELQSRVSDEALRETAEAITDGVVDVQMSGEALDEHVLAVLRERMR
jgi:hypothetical protein